MKKTSRAVLLLVFPLLSLTGIAAAAQERPIPLDAVLVEVNSRASPALGAATRAVQVIDAEEIRNSPASSVSDVLQWAFGVEHMPRSPALVDVGIRGSSFEQVLVLVDGVRMRDGQTGHFNLNLAVPLDQVERIEILRGPAASLYGSDAMAGVINVVTRKRGESSAVSLAAGTFDTGRAALSHARQVGRARVDLAGSYEESDGHRSGTDFEIAMARLAVELPVADLPLSLDLAHALRDFGASGFYGDYPAFESTRTTTASLRTRLAGGVSSLEPSIRFRHHTDDFILFREDPSIYRNEHATTQLGGELIGRHALSERLQGAAGVHLFQDAIRSAALGDRTEWTTAASLEVAAGEPGVATGTAGVRADRISDGTTSVSPALSAAWWPVPEFRLRSSVGRAFRAPTWTERHYVDPGHIGSPDLAPERAWSAEAGAEAYLLPTLRLGGTAFVRRATDLIDWAKPLSEPASPWRTRNVAEAEFRGLEAQARLDGVYGFRLTAGGTWLSVSSEAAQGFESKYALRPLVESYSVSAERQVADAVRLSLRGARDRRVDEASYLRIDGSAAVALGSVLLRADLRNAFDEDYLDISSLPAEGRSVSLGIEWRTAGGAAR